MSDAGQTSVSLCLCTLHAAVPLLSVSLQSFKHFHSTTLARLGLCSLICLPEAMRLASGSIHTSACESKELPRQV